MDEERDFQRAKELALNYLSYRPRSSKEVKSHLIRKGYSSPLVLRVVQYLVERKYIDDREFARKWFLTRLQKGGYGPFLITRELLEKGISHDTCHELQKEIYPEEREYEEAKRFVEKKGYQHMKPSPQEERRLYRMLLRKGFSSSVIIQILRTSQTGEEREK